jgi:hypothetical protein
MELVYYHENPNADFKLKVVKSTKRFIFFIEESV